MQVANQVQCDSFEGLGAQLGNAVILHHGGVIGHIPLRQIQRAHHGLSIRRNIPYPFEQLDFLTDLRFAEIPGQLFETSQRLWSRGGQQLLQLGVECWGKMAPQQGGEAVGFYVGGV